MKTFGKYLTMASFLMLFITMVIMVGCNTCNICGVYLSNENPNIYIELRSDGTFYMPVLVGVMEGHWHADGGKLTLTSQFGSDTGRIEGNQIIDSHGGIWVKNGN